ncbi:flagellar biosynthesis protein FlhB, partial [bacterium]|nr:flagellar biosynthesis protein FlhB [bacterium]
MAENESGQEKTEDPTSRKMSKAREEGNIPKSTEVNNTMMLIAGVIAFYNFGGEFVFNVGEAIRYYFDMAARYEINDASYHALMLNVGLRVLYILWPFFAIFVFAALLTNIMQVGFMFVPNKLAPNMKKLNPVEGIKNLFNMRSRVELLKSVIKIFFITPVMIYFINYRMPEFMNLPLQDTRDILTHVAVRALEVSIWAIIIMLLLAIADWIYQKWQNKDDLKMTKEEVKQEMKDAQGDPKIKSRIRSIQMEMARQRMMEEVPEAEVVVTNPTEFAVALKYQTGDMAAPQVVAKGRNHLARRIREIAVANNVPIVENKPLAQSLWKLVEV